MRRWLTSQVTCYSLSPQLSYQLFYQLTRITKERGALAHDDRLDALSMAVAYWSEQMSKVVDEEMENRRAQGLIDEIKKLHALAPQGLVTFLGGAPKGNQSPNWGARRR